MKRILLSVLTACGVMSAQADLFEYSVNFQPVTSPAGATGSGTGSVIYDNAAHTLLLSAQWSGLSGTTTISHIHAPTAEPFTGTIGVATTTPTFAGFPAGVNAGTYDILLDLTLASSWNAAYVTGQGGGTVAGAEDAFATHIADGRAYWNIHTQTFSGGEINGFLTAVPVPEPSSLALAGLGALGMATLIRRKRANKC